MKYNFYTTSEAAWTGMIEAIRTARKSIYLESYVFLNDTSLTHNFYKLLADKALSGVDVRIIIDSFGSSTVTDGELFDLRSAGVEVLFFNKLIRRLHRKILITDEEIVFFGGVNVGNEYKKWHDLHMKLNGAIARAFLRSFCHTYRLCGGQDPYLLMRVADSKIEKVKHWLIEHWPMHGKYGFQWYYGDRLRAAKRKITIVSPYFYPPRWMLRALKDAQERNVMVEVILPNANSPRIATVANHAYAAVYADNNFKFYFIEGVLHAKILIIDDEEGLVGSQNIDAQSFDYNVEVGVSFRDRNMVDDLVTIVNGWKEKSKIFGESSLATAWYHYPIFLVTRLLQPFI